ncbi:MAG: hypothetical protein ACJART_002898, partial [Maribacter sp.]
MCLKKNPENKKKYPYFQENLCKSKTFYKRHQGVAQIKCFLLETVYMLYKIYHFVGETCFIIVP